jgi:hypothetical protein
MLEYFILDTREAVGVVIAIVAAFGLGYVVGTLQMTRIR